MRFAHPIRQFCLHNASLRCRKKLSQRNSTHDTSSETRHPLTFLRHFRAIRNITFLNGLAATAKKRTTTRSKTRGRTIPAISRERTIQIRSVRCSSESAESDEDNRPTPTLPRSIVFQQIKKTRTTLFRKSPFGNILQTNNPISTCKMSSEVLGV